MTDLISQLQCRAPIDAVKDVGFSEGFKLKMYRIPIFQIRPEPDLAGFMNSNRAGAGFAKNRHQR